MIRSQVPCEFCNSTPTNRYWVDSLGPDECPNLYDIFLWVCNNHSAGLDVEEGNAPEAANYMAFPDIEEAAIGSMVLIKDGRHMMKTEFGWIFSDDAKGNLHDGSYIVETSHMVTLQPVPTEIFITYETFPGRVLSIEGLPPIFRKTQQ